MAVSGDPSDADQDKQAAAEDGFADGGVSDQSEPYASFLPGLINARLGSSTSRSRQASPGHSPRLGPSRFSSSDRFSDSQCESSFSGMGSLWGRKQHLKAQQRAKRKVGRAWYGRKRAKAVVAVIGLLGFFLLFNWMMLSRLQDNRVDPRGRSSVNSSTTASASVSIRVSAYRFSVLILGKQIDS